jgi:hypothetical protein
MPDDFFPSSPMSLQYIFEYSKCAVEDSRIWRPQLTITPEFKNIDIHFASISLTVKPRPGQTQQNGCSICQSHAYGPYDAARDFELSRTVYTEDNVLKVSQNASLRELHPAIIRNRHVLHTSCVLVAHKAWIRTKS